MLNLFSVVVAFALFCAPVQGASSLALWPMPSSLSFGGVFLPVDPSNFFVSYSAASVHDSVVDGGLERIAARFFRNRGYEGPWPTSASKQVSLCVLTVGAIVPLDEDMDESYSVAVTTDGGCTIYSATQYGALHALETLNQLLRVGENGQRAAIASVVIQDQPRFSYRGVLIDTARHFLPVPTLHLQIDAMAMAKFNVMHWHIVDAQSFPYQSETWPLLAEKGAWRYPSHSYDAATVQAVIKYAAARGVRVVPEFDTPGHSTSWGNGYPDLLTKCYSKGVPNGETGPLNPVAASTIPFVQALYKEIGRVFPDKWVHIGGDEVPFGCWESNPQVQAFMHARNYTNFAQLETYYVDHVLASVNGMKKTPLCWEEVFDNGAKITPDTVVDVWKRGWNNTIAKVTKAGYRAVLSAPWYLNYHTATREDWPTYYVVEPTAFNGTAAQKKLVKGGHASLWGEYASSTNCVSRLWPRAAAVAERLWSPENVRSVAEATPRMHDFHCYLLTQGIRAEPPQGPSFCPVEWVGA